MTQYYKIPLTGEEIERKLTEEYLPAKQGAENAGKVLVIDANGDVVPGEALPEINDLIELDTSLTTSGKAADAKATGDKINEVKKIANSKMDKQNPTGTGSFSLNRAERYPIGNYSFAAGESTIAEGKWSNATGQGTWALGKYSYAGGRSSEATATGACAIGESVIADGKWSNAFGTGTRTYGINSHAEGKGTEAYNQSTHVQGSYNISNPVYNVYVSDEGNASTLDTTEILYSDSYVIDQEGRSIILAEPTTSCALNAIPANKYYIIAGEVGNYIYYALTDGATKWQEFSYGKDGGKGEYLHIVGNGESYSTRSNAHTLDWDGNAWYAGDIYVGSTSGTNRDSGSKKLATEEYADNVSNAVKNDLLNGAGDAYDTLKELGDLINENVNAIDALETIATNKANSSDLTSHIDNKSNPHSVTASQVGLGNVNNTSDADKPVSTAQATAIADAKKAGTDAQTNLNTHIGNKNNPHGVTASQVGLGNVNNTSDANKPVSTAQATAIADAKKAGSDAQANLNTHINNKSNPHGVTLSQLGVTASAAELNYVDGVTSNIQTQLNNKLGDYSIELYNGTGGNPKPVRFASFNYSTCNSENGISAKIGMVSGHGNGSSYAFLQDVIIKVNHLGDVSVDNFKYYGATTGTYDGAARQYGDIFWLVDETNKIIDFYVLMGQYARVNMTPWKRLTHSTGGTVTQHTSCTVYSSGTKNWGNNDMFALKSDISNLQAQIDALTASAIAVLSGPSEPTAEMGDDGDIYIITE